MRPARDPAHEHNPPEPPAPPTDGAVEDLIASLDPNANYYLTDGLELTDLYAMLVPATERGQSQTISAKVPNALASAIDLLVASRSTPFQSRTDLVRSALFMFVHLLARKGLGPKMYRDAIRIINIGVIRAQMAQRKADMEKYLEGTAESLRMLVDAGNVEAARELLGRTEKEIESLDDPFWKKMGKKWMKTEGKGIVPTQERLKR